MNADADYTQIENPATINLAEKREEYRAKGEAKGITDERRWAIEQLRKSFSDEGYKGEQRWALNFQTAAVKRFGPAAGIFLRQLLFWADKGHNNEGWIYKRREEWHTETGLGIRDLQRARRVLRGQKPWGDKEAVVVMEERQPSRRAPMEYRLDPHAVLEALLPESSYKTTEVSYRPAQPSYEPPEMSYGAAIHREQQESTAETTSIDTPLQGAAVGFSAASPPRLDIELKNQIISELWCYLEHDNVARLEAIGGRVSASELVDRVMPRVEAESRLRGHYEAVAQECLDARYFD